MSKNGLTYKTYHVELQFRNGLAGGLPMTNNLAREYAKLFAAGKSSDLHLAKAEGTVTEEAMEKWVEKLTSVFPRDEVGPYIRGYQVVAMLRDSLKLTQYGHGTNSGLLKFLVQNGGVDVPDRIRIDGGTVEAERPVSPEVKGVRVSSFAHFEVAERAHLSFDLRVIENGQLPKTLMKSLFHVGGNNGLGAFRHLGYGKFDVEAFN